MKALKLLEPGKLVYEDNVPIPEITADEVLVRVKACGVCGSDFPRILKYGAYRPNLIPGHEFSGVIEALGASVRGWKTGDRVCAVPLIPCFECPMCQEDRFSLCRSYDYLGSRSDGAMAEYVRVPVRNLIALPDEVSFEAGAMLDPAANAAHAWKRVNLRGARSVAVMGLGAIGLFAIQLAKKAGISLVAGVDVSPEKLALGKLAGADVLVNSAEVVPHEELIRCNDGQGFDIILEASGVPAVQEQAVLSAGNGAEIVFLGISHKELTLNAKAVDMILRKELALKGSWNSFSGPFPGAEWTETITFFQGQQLWHPEFISHRLSLEEGAEFFRQVQQTPRMFYSKVMLLP